MIPNSKFTFVLGARSMEPALASTAKESLSSGDARSPTVSEPPLGDASRHSASFVTRN